jgi:hypothetical protein
VRTRGKRGTQKHTGPLRLKAERAGNPLQRGSRVTFSNMAEAGMSWMRKSDHFIELRGLESGNASGMEDADVDQYESKSDHGHRRHPGNDVERARVDLIAHQVTAIHKQEHEN